MNKLTKLLSVFIIAGAIGTGVAGAVGCSNTDPKPEGEHNHQTWSEKGTDNGNGTHKLTCTTDGCTETKNEDHKDANNDKKCDVCDAAMGGGTTQDPNAITSITITASKTTLDAGEELTLTATCAPSTAANKAVKWSISDCDSTLEGLVSITEDGGKITVSGDSKKGGEFTVKATSVATPSVYKEETFVVNKTSRYQELAKEQGVIIAQDFNSIESLANYDLSTAGTAGVYQSINNAAGSVADYYVEIKEGKAVQVDKGGYSTITRVNFGQLESGAIRGYFEMSVSASAKITPVMFKAANDAEVFGLRNEDGFTYRLDGGSAVAVSPATNWTGKTTYGVYFEITADKKISVEIDDVKVVDGVTISKDIAYIDFVSQGTNSSGGAAVVTLDNVVIIGQAKVFYEGYKTEGKAKLTAALGTYTEANYRAADWTTLTAAKATGDTEIEAATSFGEVDAAVLKATTAMAAVKTDLALTKEEQIALVDEEIAKYTEADYTAENWTAMQNLVADAKADINAAKTKEEAQAPMTTLPDALADVPDKNTVSYKVTFVNTDITAVNIKQGETVTKPADPKADNSEFKGWYTDATYATEFDFDNTTITAATSIYAKWVGIYNQMGTKLDGVDKTSSFSSVTWNNKSVKTAAGAGGLVSVHVNDDYGSNDYCVVGGETKDGNGRDFKIDLSSKGESEELIIKIVYAIRKKDSSDPEKYRAFLTKDSNSKDGAPIGGYQYNTTGKDYAETTIIYTVNGGATYYFINPTSNMRIYSIEVYESTMKEITDVTGSVTLGDKDAIDLSAVKFITSDDEEIAADTIPQGVTATLSEDKTKVTVSYGKISKEFAVTSAS
ncbi:MAG: InlB B-repeat-containing protein [Clostridia bacterium]|nr:InlB B-repeat-containing protein [Clostridia bacterium]